MLTSNEFCIRTYLQLLACLDELYIDKSATLTHILPLVNKKFYSIYTKSDYLWKNALIRLATKKGDLWGDAMMKFLYRPLSIPSDSITDTNSANYEREVDNDDQKNVVPFLNLSSLYYEGFGEINGEKIVSDAGNFMAQIVQAHGGYFTSRRAVVTAQQQQQQRTIYMELYRHILSQYIKYRSPLFYMPDQVQLGNEFGIHFFEPRYRLLIAEVMRPFPSSYKNGETITPRLSKLLYNHNHPFQRSSSPFPSFIYANNSPLKSNSVVTIVEVSNCIIHENQTADVFLNPVSYGRIEVVRERPNSHHLYEAKIVRMEEAECEAFDEESNARLFQQRRQFVTEDLRAMQEDDDDDDDDDDGRDQLPRQFVLGDHPNVNEYLHSMMVQLIQAANQDRGSDSDEGSE